MQKIPMKKIALRLLFVYSWQHNIVLQETQKLLRHFIFFLKYARNEQSPNEFKEASENEVIHRKE